MWGGGFEAPPGSFCRTNLGWSYEGALALGAAVTIGGGVWLHAWDRHLPPGWGRLLVAAPLVLVNLLVPLLFCKYEDAITLLIMAFNLSWLANFKALSWALNRGALCMLRFTPTQFWAVYAAPVTPVAADGQIVQAPQPSPSSSAPSDGGKTGRTVSKAPAGGSSASLVSSSGSAAQQQQQRGQAPLHAAQAYPLRKSVSQGRLGEDAGSGGVMVASWAAKLAFIVFIVWVLQHPLPPMVDSFAYGMALYGLLSAIMDGPAAVVIGLTGLRVSPHFDRPWRSTTVASFWSKRWDLTAGNTLRQLIYDVICEGRLLALPAGAPLSRPSAARQALGTTASFAVSGAIHELIFWYLTGRTTGGYWFCFFLVQAPSIVLERLALAALKRRGIRLPDWLRNLATALLVVGTGQALFWPPCSTYGVVASAVGNTQLCIVRMAAAARAALG